jgi:hypothetical protein
VTQWILPLQQLHQQVQVLAALRTPDGADATDLLVTHMLLTPIQRADLHVGEVELVP